MSSRFLSGTRLPHSLQTLIKSRRGFCYQPITNTLDQTATFPPRLSYIEQAPLHQSFTSRRWIYAVYSSSSGTSSHRGSRSCFSSSFSAEAGDGNGKTGNMGSFKKKSKVHTFYVCEHCGESYGQWWGKCNSCKMQGTLKKFSQRLEEGGGAGVRAAKGASLTLLPQDRSSAVADHPSEPLEDDSITSKPRSGRSWMNVESMLGPQRLTDVLKGISSSQWRMPLVGSTGLEIARVLGGGLVPGSLILLGGDPGVGKSTLLLQLCSILAEGCEFYRPAPVLYVSGEESEEQISSRADRLNISSEDLFLYSATNLEVQFAPTH